MKIAGLVLVAGMTAARPAAAAHAAPAALKVSVGMSGVISLATSGQREISGTVTATTTRGASCSGTVRIGSNLTSNASSTTLPTHKARNGSITWHFSIFATKNAAAHGTAQVSCTLGKSQGHGSRSF